MWVPTILLSPSQPMGWGRGGIGTLRETLNLEYVPRGWLGLLRWKFFDNPSNNHRRFLRWWAKKFLYGFFFYIFCIFSLIELWNIILFLPSILTFSFLMLLLSKYFGFKGCLRKQYSNVPPMKLGNPISRKLRSFYIITSTCVPHYHKFSNPAKNT